tara:strand:+ start:66 stop:347 length:282 start_codon:yes stop_codon:yes gene_type:complete
VDRLRSDYHARRDHQRRSRDRHPCTRDENVEPYAIIGGNPAREIRKRFAPEAIAMLLEMSWWDWSEDALREAMPILTSSDIPALYDQWVARTK